MAQNTLKPTLELYLIRHARSKGNISGMIAENASLSQREDPELAAEGVLQAKRLGEYVSSVSFQAVYASCMKRTVQTANEILNRQNDKNLPLLLHPVFTEFNISPDYKGEGLAPLTELCSKIRLCPEVSEQDGLIWGSSLDDEKTVLSRASRALEYLNCRYQNGEKVAVVSHAGFITNMVFSVLGFTEKCPPCDISFDNAGISLIRFYKAGENPFGDVIIEYLNRLPKKKEEA